MSLDAYSPCPCGSGKKLKFCCQPIAAEMERVERYQQGQQTRLALLALDAIDRKHPGNAWAVTARAEILLHEGEADEATEVLEGLIREQPDHKYAIGLMALASFSADGYELAKPAIHRAYQRCARSFPALTANLAMGIAGTMLGTARYLSARAHLGLALGMAPDDDKAEVFHRLVQFDGNRRAPFPLRSVHELAEFTPAENKQEEARKAHLLCLLGCWRPAAKILSQLAEEQPDDAALDAPAASHPSRDAALWYDVGLCRAWDGDEKLAAEALHKAAALQSDRETAVEWETLAQLLDNNVSEDRVQLLSRRFDVSSISRLIGVLDDDERFSRVELPDDPDDDMPAAVFHVDDRPEFLKQPPESLTLETLPNLVAQITIFDADEDDDEEEEEVDAQPPRAIVTGREGDAFEAAVKLFVDAAGDLVTQGDPEDDEESTPTIPRDYAMLMWRWDFPDGTPLGVRRRLDRDMWRKATLTVWPDAPLSALGGKSPRQAAGDPALAVPLRAVVNVLDAYCDRSRFTLPLAELLQDLGIDPPDVVHFDGESSLTALQLKRVAFQELDDEKLGLLLQRAVLIRHAGFLYDVLREVFDRPGCLQRFDEEQLVVAMADLCAEQRRRDECLQWIARGREIAKTGENAFQRTLEWVIQELTVRLEEPDDPEIMPLLRHIGDYYLPKLPELRDEIEAMAELCGVTPPWFGDDKPATAVGAAQGSLWTPDRHTPEPAAAAKRLWLPGE